MACPKEVAHCAGADRVENLVRADGIEHVDAARIILVARNAPAQALGFCKSEHPTSSVRFLQDVVTSPSSVLRTNRNFRLLYIGQAISQLGDWFNSVAVFALILDLTGSATAVAWMMIVQ